MSSPAEPAAVAGRLAEITREYDKLAYAISHDLRAPLRAIDGFSTALAEDYGGQLDDVARDYLSRIVAASRRMRDMLEGMLLLSRSSRQDVDRQSVDVAALAREIFAGFAAREPGRNVTLCCADAIRVSADARLTEVLVRLLLENSWKFTRQSKGSIIELRAEPGNGFCVRDDGIGFELERAVREDLLFNPFQVFHTEQEGAGVGMGLAVANCVARRHGGRLRIESRPGGGTSVHVSLSPVGS